MDGITGMGSGAAAQASGGAAEDLALLKKAQDMAKENAASLLAMLPAPRSPSPAGVGGKLDLMA